MISRRGWEWEGCDNWEVMTGLKGQGRCRLGSDVVSQQRAWGLMQSGSVAAGIRHAALPPPRDRPVKLVLICGPPTWHSLNGPTEGKHSVPSIVIISLPGV